MIRLKKPVCNENRLLFSLNYQCVAQLCVCVNASDVDNCARHKHGINSHVNNRARGYLANRGPEIHHPSSSGHTLSLASGSVLRTSGLINNDAIITVFYRQR